MEKTPSVDQYQHPKLAAIATLLESDFFARQGAVVATWRHVGQHRLGPYYALRYRDGRRQRSVYLGASQELADEVQQLLRDRQQRRQLDRLRSAIRRSLRHHKADLRTQLQIQFGRTLKGFEVRRWQPTGEPDAPAP